LDLVEGSAPFKTEEKPTSNVRVRRAGYVGAPATPGVTAHRGKEKKEENLWTGWHLISELLGTSNVKEGAVVAVGERTARGKERATGRKVR
jgi:hypothetical protein